MTKDNWEFKSSNAYFDEWRCDRLGEIMIHHELSKHIQERTILELEKRMAQTRGRITAFSVIDVVASMYKDLENTGRLWKFKD